MGTQSAEEPEIAVLLSGGIDSSACLHLLTETGRPCEALFVNYSQAAKEAEEQSARQVARYYRVPFRIIELKGTTRKADGLIPARNLMLLSIALMERAPSVTAIALGIHAGTQYRDCSEEFLVRAQEVTELCQPAHVEVIAPFATWMKGDIVGYCQEEQVPVHLTYSCESGDEPCGRCLSCKDRMRLNACSQLNA